MGGATSSTVPTASTAAPGGTAASASSPSAQPIPPIAPVESIPPVPAPPPAPTAPPVPVSFNPTGLNPPPQFSTSARSVTYDDCFPRVDDVVAGDVSTNSQEQYYGPTIGIVASSITSTVTATTPWMYDSRPGVSVVVDIPPEALTVPFNAARSGAEIAVGYLRGSVIPQTGKSYPSRQVGFRTIDTSTPIAVGDLSAGHTSSPYALGDSVVNTSSSTFQNLDAPSQNSASTISEKISFIGVEENTAVPAGVFPYTCVFRHEASIVTNGKSGSSVYDTYTHRWGTAKTVVYSPTAPRPLVFKLISASDLTRRIKASP